MVTHRTHLFLFALALVMSVMTSDAAILSTTIAAGPDPGFLPVDQQTFDAPDLWIDSQANGFDTYVLGKGPTGTPRQTGDPLGAGVVHRVYARVHNFGNEYPNGLTVRFYVRQPIGFGDESQWQLIGTLDSFGPIAPQSFRDGCVQWTPTTAAPALFKVETEPSPNDASLANNSIVERSFFLDGAKDGPLEFDLSVRNPNAATGTLSFSTTLAPDNQPTDAAPSDDQAAEAEDSVSQSGWSVMFSPATARLRARESIRVHVLVQPPPCVSLASLFRIRVSLSLLVSGRSVWMDGFFIYPRPYKQSLLSLTCPMQPVIINGQLHYHLTGTLQELSCPDNTIRPLANQYITLRTAPIRDVINFYAITDSQGRYDIDFYDGNLGDGLSSMVRGEQQFRVSTQWGGDQLHPAVRSSECTFQAPCQPLAASPLCTKPNFQPYLPAIVDANCRIVRVLDAGQDCVCLLDLFIENCVDGLTFTINPPLEGRPVGVPVTITTTARDAAGHTATCTKTVIPYPANVLDDLMAPVTLEANANCQARFDPPAVPSCVRVTYDPPLPRVFGLGTHTVQFTLNAGAAGFVNFMKEVVVVGRTPPKIDCPADITTNCATSSGAEVMYTATATDTCDPNPALTCTPPSGSTFPLGATVVNCTATNAGGNSSTCSFTVTAVMNNPPTADAGPDQNVVGNENGVTVTLDGTGSSDPDEQPLAFFWVQISGPAVALDDPSSPTPSFSQPTDYTTRTFQLTVIDACGATATDTVSVFAHFP
jgi:hypothetical protein